MSTCGDCKHMLNMYWNNGYTESHLCGKSKERRRDEFKSCGDASTDFLNDFRSFYDAYAAQPACKYFENAEQISDTKRGILVQISLGVETFPFFSEENRVAESMSNRYVERDDRRDKRRGEGRAYKLTRLGKHILAQGAPPAEIGNQRAEREGI